MTDATDLWSAVVTSYDADGLIQLTNANDRSQTAVDTTAGQDAATAVLALWPAIAQVAYDGSNALHLEAAKQGVIAMLWRRGGSSSTIEQVKWDTVFGDDGLLVLIKKTSSRGHTVPTTNSTTARMKDSKDGRTVLGWSDSRSLPPNYMPNKLTDPGV